MPCDMSKDSSSGCVRVPADTHASLHLVSYKSECQMPTTFKNLDERVLTTPTLC